MPVMRPNLTTMTGAYKKPTSTVNPIARAVGQIEALCGVVCAALLSLMILGAALYGILLPWLSPADNQLHLHYPLAIAAAAVLILVAEFLSFKLMLSSVHNAKSKRLLTLAEDHPTLPIASRPVVFAWWAIHFALIVFLGHTLIHRLNIVEDPTLYQRWMTGVIRLLFAIGISFTSNSYLMLMAASLTHRRGVLEIVYRLRIIADLLLCTDLLLPRQWL